MGAHGVQGNKCKLGELSDVGLRFGIKNVTDVSLQEESESFYSRELDRNYFLSANCSL